MVFIINAAQVTPQKKRSAPGTKFLLNNTCHDKKASLGKGMKDAVVESDY